MAEHESSLAVLVNFENMARPGAKGRNDFDIHLVLDRLAEKGRVLVKRAYADWSRYRDARHELQNAGLGLIEMPSAREGAKNRADIQMAVNAMELAYSRDHVNNFVIVSGDSDFTPLVGKLRELNKRVIGVGSRESASDLLVANCDEFIYYDTLVARASGGTARRRGGSGPNPLQLLQETLTALQREGTEWPLASVVKDSMRRKYPAFDETDHGFSTFSKFLEDAAAAGMVKIETDPRSGTYRVELADTTAGPPAPEAAPVERVAEEGEGRRRRRRGRRAESPEPEAAEGAEVFEVRIEPTPDPDLGTLPPLDEPISYEDMVMYGPPPESGEDVPDLVEVTDFDADEPPPRSSRRRRRRAAVAEPEPTVADLEPVDEVLVGLPAEAVPGAEAGAAEAPEETEAAARRRRRRRTTAAAEPEAAARRAAGGGRGRAARGRRGPADRRPGPGRPAGGAGGADPAPGAPAGGLRRGRASAGAARRAGRRGAGRGCGGGAEAAAPRDPQEGRAGRRGRHGRGGGAGAQATDAACLDRGRGLRGRRRDRRRGGAQAATALAPQEGRARRRGGGAQAPPAHHPQDRRARGRGRADGGVRPHA